MKIITEGAKYLDFSNVIMPLVSVDEYEAKIGKDSDIVTLTFMVKSKQAGEDLSGWFERGYDWVLDAKVSDGEISPNRYLVFVEMYRRRAIPERIIEMLADLETLCGCTLKDWTIKVDDVEYDADVNEIKAVIQTSPLDYKKTKDVEKETQLNEYRHRAGIQVKAVYDTRDPEITNIKTIAGL